MRTRAVALLALALIAFAPAVATAQKDSRVLITAVRVGFPHTNQGYGLKAGAWAPVFIDVATAPGIPVSRLDGFVALNAKDPGDLQAVYREDLPSLAAGQADVLVSYVRLPSQFSEPSLTLNNFTDRVFETWELPSQPSPLPTTPGAPPRPSLSKYTVVEPEKFVYLSVGRYNSRLKEGLRGRFNANAPADQDVADQTKDHRDFFHVESVQQMPTKWFGYDSADVVLLYTGANSGLISNNQTGTGLLEDRSGRKEALAEWVRRGGTLIVSVGSNYVTAAKLIDELKLIKVEMAGELTRDRMDGVMVWAGKPDVPFDGGTNPLKYVEFKNLGPDVQVLGADTPKVDDPGAHPVIVQSSCGLGRVILVAFDLEKAPFTQWGGNPKFWEKVSGLVEPKIPKQAAQDNPQQFNQFGNQQSSNELATRFFTKLDFFDEVPVVSFGWVALFILIYIIVVGPLDYLFLNKVVKRPELTWITFPAVVIGISVLAYFTAYWLKGNDLRINKVDLVDIVAEMDSRSSQSKSTAVYGNTWFTLFSPRIQNYNVGVLPPENNTWVPNKPRDQYSVVTTWFGEPNDPSMGAAGGFSLYKRGYDYAPGATGMEGVPIQVWTTKAFQASWKAELAGTGAPPLITADLGHPQIGKPGLNHLTGFIDSNLPVTLKDVTLIYRGNAFDLDKLPPGRKPVNTQAQGSERKFKDWVKNVPGLLSQTGGYQYGSSSYKPAQPDWSILMTAAMFSRDIPDNTVRNSLMRSLDQSWQIQTDRPEMAILVGKAVPANPAMEKAQGKEPPSAEDVTNDPVSASQLWLDKLPSQGGQRQPLNGKMTQETYVRIFLPVKK